MLVKIYEASELINRMILDNFVDITEEEGFKEIIRNSGTENRPRNGNIFIENRDLEVEIFRDFAKFIYGCHNVLGNFEKSF